MPRMTHQVAILTTQESNEESIKTITESEDYFDKILAVESKDLKFHFDVNENTDTLMYSYFMQSCGHQQNLEEFRSDFSKMTKMLKDLIYSVYRIRKYSEFSIISTFLLNVLF